MNRIILKGVMRNISYSHTINDVEYDKADLIILNKDGNDDVVSLRFKKFSNPYKDGDKVDLVGNIRSYSTINELGKSSVLLYVFTYFDIPMMGIEEGNDLSNYFEIDGRVCKIGSYHVTDRGKTNLHFTLANNIITPNNKHKINNYCPVVAWGNLAKEYKDLSVNDRIIVSGKIHSRTYRKELPNGDYEFRVAHELIATNIRRTDE